MSHPPIPQELIQRIIQQLASDKHTLKTASLVSSSFRQWCQELLFAHLTLTLTPQEPSRGSPFQDIIDRLEASPTIGACFKSIRIEDSLYRNTHDALVNDPWVWLLHDKIFPRAFDLIRTESIQKFSLAVVNFSMLNVLTLNSGYSWWCSLPRSAKAVITRILQSPSLVHIETTYLPPQVAISLCWGNSVKRLDINTPRFDMASSKDELAIMEDTGGGSRRLQLETLAFSGESERYFEGLETLINYILDGNRSGRACVVNLKTVKKLKVSISAIHEYRSLEKLASECHSLEALALDTCCFAFDLQSWTAEMQTINFPMCPGLRKLFIRGPRTLVGRAAPPDILQIVINSLRGMLAANVIEDVHLFFRYNFVQIGSRIRELAFEENAVDTWCQPGPWSTLDEILSDKVRFPMLKRVKIDSTAGVAVRRLVQGMDEMRRRTEELMPNLKEQGLLELNLLVEGEWSYKGSARVTENSG
ncbi:hypothetical protein FA15DRAFT_123508 [Coprinopsis marcescibilis]|uniref:F-box domain-containing protein n=1 Tax=Coprinopsis marcescibilis TaxID=230819 RepID=A0A5C3KKQ0_COPMA|nr:hypothetical protein FA15DRAFT_123508 [Coprinopsis marcescibilis]